MPFWAHVAVWQRRLAPPGPADVVAAAAWSRCAQSFLFPGRPQTVAATVGLELSWPAPLIRPAGGGSLSAAACSQIGPLNEYRRHQAKTEIGTTEHQANTEIGPTEHQAMLGGPHKNRESTGWEQFECRPNT